MDGLADTVIMMLVFATLAAAWSWLGSYAGIISLGHAVFFGIGAFAVAVSNFRGGSPWYGALGGALFSVLVGVICALVCLRGRGFTFAALTLALGALAEPFVAAHQWLGPGNVYDFPVHPGFLSLQFTQKWPYLLLALAVFGVTLGLTFGLRSLRIGYYLRALRASPAAARSLGVRALPPRLAALAASAFVTSTAGSFFAQFSRGVSPHDFALSLSLDIALVGIVAGPASPWGPACAGAVFALIARFVPLHPPGAPGIVVSVLEAVIIAVVALRLPSGVFTFIARRPAAAARNPG